jgi:hypothetical protein
MCCIIFIYRLLLKNDYKWKIAYIIKQMTNHLKVKDYIKLLEQKGYFLLGEPLVRYKMTEKSEQVAFFMTYADTKIQTILNEINLVEDANKVNKVLALSIGISNQPTYLIYTLKDFIKKHGSRMVHENHVIPLKNARPYQDIYSLLASASTNILKNEHNSTNTRKVLNQSINTFDYLFPKVDKDRVEQVIYLSKVHDLPKEELAELTELPLSWLVDSIPINPVYTQITLPFMNKVPQANRQVYPI